MGDDALTVPGYGELSHWSQEDAETLFLASCLAPECNWTLTYAGHGRGGHGGLPCAIAHPLFWHKQRVKYGDDDEWTDACPGWVEITEIDL